MSKDNEHNPPQNPKPEVQPQTNPRPLDMPPQFNSKPGIGDVRNLITARFEPEPPPAKPQPAKSQPESPKPKSDNK